MSSVLNGGGLNYQGGNPLRREIMTLRADITALQLALKALISMPQTSNAVGVAGPPGVNGTDGAPGPQGVQGPPGPLSYIAMPAAAIPAGANVTAPPS